MRISKIKIEPIKIVHNLELVASSGKNEFGLTSFANLNLKDFCSNSGKMSKADFKIATHQE